MQTIYLGRDNTFDIALEADFKVRAADGFNRQVLYMKDPVTGTVVTIDSSTAPAGTFDTTPTVYFKNTVLKVVRCKLGLGSLGLVADTVYECWLRLFSASITNGQVWPDDGSTFRLKVVSGP